MPTQDITIYNEEGNNSAEVDSGGYLSVKSKLTDGTSDVSITNNKLDVNAVVDFSQQAVSVGAWLPEGDQDLAEGEKSPLFLEAGGNLKVRAQVLTDEGAILDHFPGSSISEEWTVVEGTGGSVSVADSYCTIESGTTADSETYIALELDYLPIRLDVRMYISQRIENQEVFLELVDDADPALTVQMVRFRFDGTDSNIVYCDSCNHQGTGGCSGTSEKLRTDYSTDYPFYWVMSGTINSFNFAVGSTPLTAVPIKDAYTTIPGPYTGLYLRIRIKNGSTPPASSTSVKIDSVRTVNINRIDVANDFPTSPINAQITDNLYTVGYTYISTANSDMNIYRQGGVNSYILYPNFISENQQYSNDLVYTNTATTNNLQIFKPALDTNLYGVELVLGTSGAETTIDTFDSSVTTNWISSDTSNTVRSAEASIVYEGSGSMEVTTRFPKSLGDYVRRTISATDYSSATSFSFAFRSSNINQQWRFRISDGTNTLQSPIFSAQTVNTWSVIEFDIEEFTEITAGTTNTAAITRLEFYVVNNTTSTNYFDILKRITATSLMCEVELYDFGTTANPTNISQGSLITSDRSETSIIFEVFRGVRRRYKIEFLKGVLTSNNLTEGNYYGILIKTEGIIVYGHSTTAYSSGKNYSIVTSTGALTDTTNSAFFGIYTIPDICFLTTGIFSSSQSTGDSSINLFVSDSESTHNIVQQLINEYHIVSDNINQFSTGNRIISIPKGYNIRVDINHDVSAENFTKLSATGIYIRKPIPRNN